MQVEGFHQGVQVGGEGVVVVAGPDLRRAAEAATVVGDDSVAGGEQLARLALPAVTAADREGRPAGRCRRDGAHNSRSGPHQQRCADRAVGQAPPVEGPPRAEQRAPRHPGHPHQQQDRDEAGRAGGQVDGQRLERRELGGQRIVAALDDADELVGRHLEDHEDERHRQDEDERLPPAHPQVSAERARGVDRGRAGPRRWAHGYVDPDPVSRSQRRRPAADGGFVPSPSRRPIPRPRGRARRRRPAGQRLVEAVGPVAGDEQIGPRGCACRTA